MKDIKLASKESGTKRTIIEVNGVRIGERLVVIAGPCAVESEYQLMKTAEAVKKAGADMLRGGAFKPRTSPYSFQGLGLKGLKILEKARKTRYVRCSYLAMRDASLLAFDDFTS